MCTMSFTNVYDIGLWLICGNIYFKTFFRKNAKLFLFTTVTAINKPHDDFA